MLVIIIFVNIISNLKLINFLNFKFITLVLVYFSLIINSIF